MTDEAGFPELVRELMTVGVFTCTADALIVDLVPHFLEKDLEEVMVMEEGNAIGVIGREELVSAIENPEWKSLKVEDLMREDFLIIPPDTPLTLAVKFMQDKNVRAAFIMHNAAGLTYPAGILTFRHILHLLAANTPEDLSQFGVNAPRQSPLEAFIEKRDAAIKKARENRRKY